MATPHIDVITEVLRFLRAEGDVVVGAGQDGNYSVNGTAMRLDDVLSRANRIRARQGKEPFRLNVA